MKPNIENIALLYNLDVVNSKRVVPIQNRSVSGRFYSRKNKRLVDFESTLERDYFYSLEFDEHVIGYDEQPFGVIGKFNGRKVTYRPDVIVSYGEEYVPAVIEVKYSADLEDPDKKVKLENKFSVLDEWAKENGVEHRVVTEEDIRSIRLNNQKFLYGYIEPRRSSEEHKKIVLEILNYSKRMRVVDILEAYSSDEMEQPHILPTIWHMLVTGQLVGDIDKPLNNHIFVEEAYGNN